MSFQYFFSLFIHFEHTSQIHSASEDGATFYALDIILDIIIFHTQPMKILMINTDPK